MIQNYINHIVFTIDASDSMRSLTNQVVKVFDNQVKYLAELSQDLKQETRVSVYLFGCDVSCLIYDMDVLRLPSLRDHYRTDGMTALIDGAVKSIEDLKLIPELYCDHAFLVYVLTDGQENYSDKKPSYLSKLISGLGDNWTIGVMVPNKHSIEQAKQFGFPENNIEVWSVGKEGVSKVGDRIKEREYLSTRPSPRLAQDDAECPIPPIGWRCTRGKGHSGPCAAIPNTYPGLPTDLQNAAIEAFKQARKRISDAPRTDSAFQILFKTISVFSKGEISADDLKAQLHQVCEQFRELERELNFITTDREALADRLELAYKERDAFERNLNKTYEDFNTVWKKCDNALDKVSILLDFINKEMKMTATDPRLVELVGKLK